MLVGADYGVEVVLVVELVVELVVDAALVVELVATASSGSLMSSVKLAWL